jgi:hypothetical protein
MPKHIFTVVVRGHSVDVQTNNITLFSVLEEIGAQEVPFAFPGFAVVTLWKRQPGEEGVRFVQHTSLIDPSGKEVLKTDITLGFEKPRQRSIIIMQGAPFSTTGEHHIEVRIRREDSQESALVTEYPLEVRLLRPDEKSKLLPAAEAAHGS